MKSKIQAESVKRTWSIYRLRGIIGTLKAVRNICRKHFDDLDDGCVQICIDRIETLIGSLKKIKKGGK
jgi:hypothetical protein